VNLGFVLVHGGAHASWCWERLIPYLQHPAIAVDLPGRGSKPADLSSLTVSDCVASVVDDIDRSGFDRVVLVGHSLAGVVLPAIAEKISDRVARLVFVSASIPPEGGNSLDSLPRHLRLLARRNARRTIGRDQMPRWLARRMFCSDMDEKDTAYVLERLVPESIGLVFENVSRANLPRNIPITYIKLLRDKALSPRIQERMIANLPGADVHSLEAGHDAMISRPKELAKLLDEIATRS
jgi:pimeloyl-ACP methyl ester carboxylesterase